MKMYRTVLERLILSTLFSTVVCLAGSDTLIGTYTNIATATYHDTLKDAKDLEVAINSFAKEPIRV